MSPLIQLDAQPELRDPIMVIVLTGWVDAGMAGAGAVAVLGEQLEARRTFGHIDLADLLDLQQTRPTVHLVAGTTREVVWPSIDLIAGHLGRDVVICMGPEPSLRWQAVLGELVTLAQQLGVTRAFTLGGIPSVASHRRPVHVLATGTSPELVAEIGGWRSDYQGPGGASSALQVMLGAAGVPTVALWAQVPHYVSTGPSPTAIRALLARMRDLSGVLVDLGPLDDQVRAYIERVDAGLSDRPDVAEVVRAIEEGSGSEEEPDETQLPSGDELASEIERFLRDQS
jgi:proteasome assembly chaperone (PAC2) family protein